MTCPILSTAADAWRHLVTTAGLDADGYDQPLVLALSDHRGLGLSPTGDVARELDRLDVSIEDFLAAFFRAMKPYGEMLRDLLDLFTEAGAHSASTIWQCSSISTAEASWASTLNNFASGLLSGNGRALRPDKLDGAPRLSGSSFNCFGDESSR